MSTKTLEQNWMSETAGLLKQPLSQLVLPQSHDSGSYKLNGGFVPNFQGLNGLIEFLDQLDIGHLLWHLTKCYAQTQDLTIFQQLLSGVRILDFRICAFNSELQLHHGPLLGEPLQNALEDIHNFLEESDCELVIIEAAHYDLETYPGGITAALNEMMQLAQNTFGDRLVRRPSPVQSAAENTPIEQFLQNGSGVIFAVENLPSSQANTYPMLWPRIYAGPYADTDNVARMRLKAAEFAAKLPKTPVETLLQLQWIMTPQADEIFRDVDHAFNLLGQEFENDIIKYLDNHGLRQIAVTANAQLDSFLDLYERSGMNTIRSLRVDFIEQSTAVQWCRKICSNAIKL
jgi:hypothetical protein